MLGCLAQLPRPSWLSSLTPVPQPGVLALWFFLLLRSHTSGWKLLQPLRSPFSLPVPLTHLRIRAKHSRLCLNIKGNSTQSGANIIQAGCASGASAQFQLDPIQCPVAPEHHVLYRQEDSFGNDLACEDFNNGLTVEALAATCAKMNG